MRQHFHRCGYLRVIALDASDMSKDRSGGGPILDELCEARRLTRCVGLGECDVLSDAQKRDLLVTRVTRMREEEGGQTSLGDAPQPRGEPAPHGRGRSRPRREGACEPERRGGRIPRRGDLPPHRPEPARASCGAPRRHRPCPGRARSGRLRALRALCPSHRSRATAGGSGHAGLHCLCPISRPMPSISTSRSSQRTRAPNRFASQRFVSRCCVGRGVRYRVVPRASAANRTS
jgi:hypothetical protein